MPVSTSQVPPSGASAAGRRAAVAAAVLVAVTAAAHVLVLWNGFAVDDQLVLLGNRAVRSFDLRTILFHTHWYGAGKDVPYWRPLALLTFAIQHAFAGTTPWPYHLANLLFHVAATALLFVVARRLTGSLVAALIGAAVFGLHPVEVDVVSGTANRGDALAAACVLCAVLAYARPGRITWRRWAATAIAVLLACLSKETGLAAIAGVAAWDAFGPRDEPPNEAEARRVRRLGWLGLAVVIAAYLLARRVITGPLWMRVEFVRNPLVAEPFWTQKALALAVLGRTVRMLAWPARLSYDYSYRSFPLVGPGMWVDAALGLAALVAVAIAFFRSRRRHGAVVVGLAIAAAAWVPVSNLFFHIEIIAADRFEYLPLAGVALALAGAVPRVTLALRPRARALGAGIASIALVALGARTALRTLDWRDERTLFSAALADYPENARVHVAWASLAEEAGDWPSAAASYERALAIWPGYAAAWSNLAGALGRMGRFQEAIAASREAVRLDPDDPAGWYNLAAHLEEVGQVSEARDVLRSAVARHPQSGRLRAYLFDLDRELQ